MTLTFGLYGDVKDFFEELNVALKSILDNCHQGIHIHFICENQSLKAMKKWVLPELENTSWLYSHQFHIWNIEKFLPSLEKQVTNSLPEGVKTRGQHTIGILFLFFREIIQNFLFCRENLFRGLQPLAGYL